MKVEKETLIEEINYRISTLEKKMKECLQQPKDENNLYWFFANEHSLYSEILDVINVFQGRIGYDELLATKYTPIKCALTKEPLKIGDKVECRGLQNRCGYLYFNELSNRYVIRSEDGGDFYASEFIKINELYDYEIDCTKIECRKNPNKKLYKY